MMNEHTLRTENLFKLTWPVFLQNATGSIVMFVDFVFFSYLSDDIAAVIGQVLPVTWLGSFIIPVFAGTGVAVASQYMGAKQFHKVIPAYMMNLLFSFVMGLSLSIGFIIFRSDIGLWMGMSEVQNEVSTVYLSMMSAFFIIMSVMVAYNAILSSRGLTHWLMMNSILTSGLNIILNAFFVLVLHWGLKGIVFSTIVSTLCSTLLAMYLVHVKLGIRFYLKGAWRDMCGVLRPMLRVGIPNAVEPFSYATQQIILSTFIISMGLQSMAANSYAGRSLMFHIIFAFSLASAAQILMAHWMGGRRIAEINRLYWRIVSLSMGVAVLYMIVIWSNGHHIISIFTDNIDIQRVGKQLFFVSLFTEPARVVNIISGFTLRSVGDSRYPMIVTIIFVWGILPFIFVYDHYWSLSIVSMWICFAVDEIIRCFINLRRWKSGKWKKMGLVEEGESTLA